MMNPKTLYDRALFARQYLTDRDGNPWIAREYQVRSLNSLATRKIHQCGRDVGKTSEIEISVLHNMLTSPHRQGLVATQRENHLYPLMERIIRRVQETPIFAPNLVRVTRAPSYCLRFTNDYVLWGRIGGLRGVNFQGLHVDSIWVDEGQEMTDESWAELMQSLNTGGSLWVYGVPNGRRNTYYRMTQMPQFEKYRWPSYLNPDFTEEKRRELIQIYGGEKSADYIHKVLGEHGSPAYGAFDAELYQACSGPVSSYRIVEIKTKEASGSGVPRSTFHVALDEFLSELVHAGGVWVGADLGYAKDPTEIVGWADDGERISALFRIHLEGVTYDQQEQIFVKLNERLKLLGIGIDNGGSGVSVVHALWSRGMEWRNLVQGYDFGGKLTVGFLEDGSEDRRPTKVFMTELIQRAMQRRAVLFAPDPDREDQYIDHSYSISPQGHIVYSKGNDHIVDADRCAFMRRYQARHEAHTDPDPGVAVCGVANPSRPIQPSDSRQTRRSAQTSKRTQRR